MMPKAFTSFTCPSSVAKHKKTTPRTRPFDVRIDAFCESGMINGNSKSKKKRTDGSLDVVVVVVQFALSCSSDTSCFYESEKDENAHDSMIG